MSAGISATAASAAARNAARSSPASEAAMFVMMLIEVAQCADYSSARSLGDREALWAIERRAPRSAAPASGAGPRGWSMVERLSGHQCEIAPAPLRYFSKKEIGRGTTPSRLIGCCLARGRGRGEGVGPARVIGGSCLRGRRRGAHWTLHNAIRARDVGGGARIRRGSGPCL